MASEITNHKCPACTGPLHFVGASGMLECDYCGSKFSVDEIEKIYAEEEAKAAENGIKNDEKKEKEKSESEAMGTEWSEDEAKGMDKEIQDLVNDYNKKIETMLKEKEQELLTV